jgi:hypothetical protein
MTDFLNSLKQTQVDVDELLINKENYRLDQRKITTVEDAMDMLFEEEDIIGMAKDIVSFGGLYPQESLLVVKEGRKNIVLEGNRRTLAIKCILNRKLVPRRFREKFEKAVGNINSDFIERIRKVYVIFVPSRDSVLRIISDKHADYSYRKWEQISQWNFVKEVFDKYGKNTEKTMEMLSAEKQIVSNYVKYYNYLAFVRALTLWDSHGGREKIESYKLEPTRLTRALGYKDVLNELEINFDPQTYDIIHTRSPSPEKMNYVNYRFARASLVDTSGDYIDTRSSKEEILGLISNWKSEFDKLNLHNESDNAEVRLNTEYKNKTKAVEINDKKTAVKPEIFFEKLKCTVNNNRLARLTEELSQLSKRNRLTDFPAAGTLLIRALLESCLRYQIDDVKHKKRDVETHYKKGFDLLTLDEIVKYSITYSQSLFQENSSAKIVLERVQSIHRVYLNSIVHNNWMDPTPASIQGIAGDIRELLRKILTGEA